MTRARLGHEMRADEFAEWKALRTVELEEQREGEAIEPEPEREVTTDPLRISRFFQVHH